ncbi:MAG: DUF1624 domain-containing protein [Planctomycetaceae bacterium]|nr:DUF1624 domain-containing protein [Planctomycetaceae bacterium]
MQQQSLIARRNLSVDFMRGCVMLLMALGHVRILGMNLGYTPVNLEFATEGLFLTRWITHFVAPAFVMLTGLGAALKLQADKSRQDVGWFLLTRGIWLVVLELTVVHYAWHFDYDALIFLQIIWVQGVSMVLLSVFLYLPKAVLWPIVLAILLGHNLLDSVSDGAFGSFEWLYRLLRGAGSVSWAGGEYYVEYPVLPWFAIMLFGFLLGELYRIDASERQRLMIRLGVSMLVTLVLLRFVNVYGDPDPWTTQVTGFRTLLSFFNAERYPPSLVFELMTLGPIVMVLGLLERVKIGATNPVCVFGRVPLFFYLAHLYLAHGLVLLIGTSYPDAWQYHPETGLSLPRVYLAWLIVIALLFPICFYYDRLKRQTKYRILSYL